MVEVGIIVSLTGGMAVGAQLDVNPQENGLEYSNEEARHSWSDDRIHMDGLCT